MVGSWHTLLLFGNLFMHILFLSPNIKLSHAEHCVHFAIDAHVRERWRAGHVGTYGPWARYIVILDTNVF